MNADRWFLSACLGALLLPAACSPNKNVGRSLLPLAAQREPDPAPIPSDPARAADPCALIAMSTIKTDWPDDWCASNDIEVLNLAEPDQERWRKIVCAALKRYPEGVLQRELDSVFVVRQIRYRGEGMGGCPKHRAVFVCTSLPRYGDCSWYVVRKMLYISIAGAMLLGHPDALDEAKWRAACPPDFRYEGWEQVLRDDAWETSPALKRNGILANFGTCDWEPDFELYAQNLILGSAELWRDAKQYPAIQKKLDLTLAFYRRVDPRLDEAFFRALAPPSRRSDD